MTDKLTIARALIDAADLIVDGSNLRIAQGGRGCLYCGVKADPHKSGCEGMLFHDWLGKYGAMVDEIERQDAPPAIDFTPPKRHVDTVFLHCSASSNDAHDDISVIRQWHLDRGWQDIGYHFFIKRDGTIQAGRDLELIPAAQAPHNTGTIAICLHGGGEQSDGSWADDFTNAQRLSCKALCFSIQAAYDPKKIRFRGHCEVAAKACPVFDYRKLLGLDQEGFMR